MSDPQVSNEPTTSFVQAVVDAAPRAILVLDEVGTIRWANEVSAGLVGEEDLVGRSILEFVVDEDAPLVLEAMGYLLERAGRFRPMEFGYRRPDGSTGVLEAVSANKLDDPVVRGIVVQCHDVTDRRVIDEVHKAIASGAPFTSTLQLIAHLVEEQLGGSRAIVAIDPVDATFRTAVSAVDVVDRLPSSQDQVADGAAGGAEEPWAAVARTGQRVIHADLTGLPSNLRAEAEGLGLGACWVFPVPAPNTDQVAGSLIVWRQHPGPPSPGERVVAERAGHLVSLALERRRSHDLLMHAARHDTLTGLPNRSQFYQRLARELAREQHLVAVLYLDLDGFKTVNDRYGHRAGDRLLMAVAARIEHALRPEDLTGRLGGDEFGVICSRLHDPDEAVAIAERLIAAVAEPVSVPEESVRSPELAALAGTPAVARDVEGAVEVSVGLSIGIAFGPQGGTNHERLIELADAAMYQAKAAGRGTWRLAPPDD